MRTRMYGGVGGEDGRLSPLSRFPPLSLQLHQLGSHFPRFDHQFPHAHRQVEAAWPGAAGIEIQDAVLLFYLRLMTVAIDHNAESSCLRLQIELAEIMQHVDGQACDIDHFRFRQREPPGPGVDVAAHRSYGRDLCEFVEDFGGTDVAGVEDAVGSTQGSKRRAPQSAVRVGDYAEDYRLFGHRISIMKF